MGSFIWRGCEVSWVRFSKLSVILSIFLNILVRKLNLSDWEKQNWAKGLVLKTRKKIHRILVEGAWETCHSEFSKGTSKVWAIGSRTIQCTPTHLLNFMLPSGALRGTPSLPHFSFSFRLSSLAIYPFFLVDFSKMKYI